MRLKEFIIFIGIFTVCYCLFFILLDIIRNRKDKKKQENRFQEIMNGERFSRFAQFYGASLSLTSEQLKEFYQIILKANNLSISTISEQYQISPYEMVVLILYFEYFHLIDNKSISMKEGIMRPMNSGEQSLAFKYGSFFLDKSDYAKIQSIFGDIVSSDMNLIQEYFLVPGVRFIDSKLYYVEGVDIHA